MNSRESKRFHHVPWKLNIVIMMQLWEGNSKGNFFSVSISKLRWEKIQFLAKKLLETWACIIQLYREPIGLSIELICVEMWAKRTPCFRSLYKSKAQRKRVLIWEEERWSKGANHAGRKSGGICFISFDERSSYKERKGNALASGADEGRDKLR